MKFTGVFLLFLACFFQVNAQIDEALPIDENGKMIYFEVVSSSNVSKAALKERATAYIKKQSKELKFKPTQGDSSVTAKGKLVINKTLLVMSHPSGEVLYHFQVDMKDNKYRFWLTDFSFIPYQRDRYGNFVPSTTVGTPLENDPGKLNSSQWKEYKAQTAKYAKEFASQFKLAMSNAQAGKPAKEEKKVISKSWK